MALNEDRYLFMNEVEKATTLSRSSIYRMEANNKFPARRQLGPNRVGWLESEVRDWMRRRQVIKASAA